VRSRQQVCFFAIPAGIAVAAIPILNVSQVRAGVGVSF
jgi:hypothetical protein